MQKTTRFMIEKTRFTAERNPGLAMGFCFWPLARDRSAQVPEIRHRQCPKPAIVP